MYTLNTIISIKDASYLALQKDKLGVECYIIFKQVGNGPWVEVQTHMSEQKAVTALNQIITRSSLSTYETKREQYLRNAGTVLSY